MEKEKNEMEKMAIEKYQEKERKGKRKTKALSMKELEMQSKTKPAPLPLDPIKQFDVSDYSNLGSDCQLKSLKDAKFRC